MVAPLQKTAASLAATRPSPNSSREARGKGKHLVAFVLRFDAVVVHLEKEIFRAENVAKLRRALARLRHVVGLDRHIDLALETRAHPNQPLGMRGEQFLVDPRLVVEIRRDARWRSA